MLRTLRKSMLLILAITTVLVVAACKKEVETVILPDVRGLSLSEAETRTEGLVVLRSVDVPSHKYLPGYVLGYAIHEPGDTVDQGQRIDVAVVARPLHAFSHDSRVDYVAKIADTSGPNSPNFDLLIDAGIGGTDLGIPVEYKGQMVLLYGDSFSGIGSHSGFWFSNFMALSNNFDLSEGLIMSSVVTNPAGFALPFAQGAHAQNLWDHESTNPNREVTKIPTGGVTIGDAFYVFYMSVRFWELPGNWFVNYNQVLKSIDGLKTFTPVESLIWLEDEAPNFGQIMPVNHPEEPGMIYLFATPGGRFGGAVLGRVQAANFENRDAYEYLVAPDTWVKGSVGLEQLLENPYHVIDAPVAEISVMFNPYLNQWMALYMETVHMQTSKTIIMKTADQIEGPYTDKVIIMDDDGVPNFYGGFVHPRYTTFDGKKFYIQISRWLPIYQTELFEVVLN
ncbi:MAG: DUF4185 domain-containing protein [Acholeplasmatales bacterium]|nr:MAG: DUF4185 domain-containing protein [Acholeplasmatales bacterium]